MINVGTLWDGSGSSFRFLAGPALQKMNADLKPCYVGTKLPLFLLLEEGGGGEAFSSGYIGSKIAVGMFLSGLMFFITAGLGVNRIQSLEKARSRFTSVTGNILSGSR